MKPHVSMQKGGEKGVFSLLEAFRTGCFAIRWEQGSLPKQTHKNESGNEILTTLSFDIFVLFAHC